MELSVADNGVLNDDQLVLNTDGTVDVGGNEVMTTASSSTSLTDTADILYEAELNTFAKLDTQIADKDLANTIEAAIEFVIDGGGSAITTGIKGDLEIPFDCTITRVTLLADQSGSIVVDLWVDTYANFPPDDNDSIADAGTPPTISTADKGQDSTLTSWTVALSAGETLRYNVDSVTRIERCTVSLLVTK